MPDSSRSPQHSRQMNCSTRTPAATPARRRPASAQPTTRHSIIAIASALALSLVIGAASAVSAQELPPSVIGQFTTGVEEREPIDQITFVENGVEKIFFFTDLRNLTGQSVTHRWSYAGEVRAEVSFEVRGPRWRVWSSKDLVADWIGDWTVEVVAGDGEVLAAETFTYSAPET